MEDIAIIGMACRFPGNATSPEKLWQMMVQKESAWSEFPKDRLNIDGYYHPSGDRQGSISFRGAHFIKDDIAAFDASFFSVMAEDAKAIDPQQRFLLEVSYEALENAGLRMEDLRGSPTAVYVGSFVKDYEQICLRDMDWQPQYAATGTGNAIMSNRVSYTYDFKGPSMTIDTGCSGSLVAVHLAAQALRAGDCSLALAAGAGLILTPNTMMPMTALNFLSPDGKCFAFDARANGYGRGEGIGFVVLKKLSDAVRDNDTIRAVIRGTHVNQDGLTTGITLPSKEAQVANIRALYAKHDLDMKQTAFVECHGTGTQAGDFRELKAISETLAEGRTTENPVFVGSVKTNIGHLEGAAGVSGLIKGVLTTEKGRIPPNINFERGNPDIDFRNWKVKVPTDLTEWPVDGIRRVSVNCFGFGGTNAHAVLDDAAVYLAERGMTANHNSSLDSTQSRQPGAVSEAHGPFLTPKLFVFSSNERKGVSRLMETHLGHITGLTDMTEIDADNYAYTLGCRRSIMEWKSFAVARSVADLTSKLQSSDETSFLRSGRESKPKLGFVFCGQGAQWAQMGLELMCFDAFKSSMTAASRHLKTLGSELDLVEELAKAKTESRIQDPQISQPATTAVQVALVDLLRACNITPSSVVGHSSGEIAAAYASTAITREAAWALAYYRGRSASLLSTVAPYLKGAMCAARMTNAEARQYIESHDKDSGLQVACVNSPNSVTISGNRCDVLRMRDELKSRQVLCKVLDVDVAYHSRHMRLVEGSYKDCIQTVLSNDASENIPFFSSVRGEMLPHSLLDPSYWVQNLVSPVQFVAAVKAMMTSDSRPDILVELSPHATLESALAETISELGPGSQATYLSLIRRDKDSAVTTLQTIGEIWARGHPVDMLKVCSKGADAQAYKTLVNLPSYPWNHSKVFWHESHTCTEHRFRNFGRQDLIGSPSPDATTFEPRWRGFFRISENPWIQDHRVQKAIVYPAAGMVTMALEAASQLACGTTDVLGFHLTGLRIERAMIIPSSAYGLEYSLNLKQLPAKAEADPEWEFTIYSKPEDGPWIRHADGSIKIRRQSEALLTTSEHAHRYTQIQGLCDKSLPPRQLYELLDVVGLNYGPCFQNVVSISTHENACISKVRVPDTKSKMPAGFEFPHVIHPATLDAMFQTLFAIDSKPMVPSSIESIFVSAQIPHGAGHEFTGFATAERHGLRGAVGSIVMASDESNWGKPLVVVDGLKFTSLSTPSIDDGGFIPNHGNLCSEVVWREDYTRAVTEDFYDMLSLMAHKYPSLSVLQCGGSMQLAQTILDILPEGVAPNLSRYTITDPDILGEAQKAYEKSPVATLLEHRNWPNVKDHTARYNLIIVARDAGIDLGEAGNILQPEGVILNETTPPMTPTSTDSMLEVELVFDDPTTLQMSCDAEPDNVIHCDTLDQHFEASVYVDKPKAASSPGVLIIMPDAFGSAVEELAKSLSDLLLQRDFKVSIGTLHGCDPKGKACIALLEACDSFVYGWTEGQFRSFHSLQEQASSLLWVTRGANRRPTNPRNAPIIALARTILSEDPQKTIVTLDLDENTCLASCALPQTVEWVLDSMLSGSAEAEFAEEGGRLYIPRLMPLQELNKMIESDSNVEIVQQPIFNQPIAQAEYEMTISQPGIDNDNFHFVESSQASQLGPYEVEIQTLSAALHLNDLHTAMGRTSGDRLGLDVLGIVKNIGSQVIDFRRGEQVLALVPGAFKTVHRVDQGFVKPAPPPVECCQYTPSALIAAYYTLCTVGRLTPRKKVLVHAGASSYGQAAIRVAAFFGAEVFATVMGENSKAQHATLIDAHRIPEDHIFDATGESFVADVSRFGKVDVLYNPTQEHTAASFKCVKPSGCVVQLADRTGGALSVPVSAAAYIKLDLGLLVEEDPDLVKDLFSIVDRFAFDYLRASSSLQCQPVHRFPMSALEDAFKQLERDPHHGLTIVEANQDTLVHVARAVRTKSLADAINPEGTYVLAGGLGGLGRSITKLLADNGAKKLVFLSRSGGGAEANTFFESLCGVDAKAIAVDITDRKALEALVPDLGKVSGVVQCAAVIKDALFEKMSHADWVTAFGPKAVGAINLTEVFGRGPSAAAGDLVGSSDPRGPWFLFLSSASGIIGNRGQANYAAANAVQDILARSLPRAVSLDLGPVLEAGMLVEDEETLSKLRGAGFYGIRHRDFLTMVERAITGEVAPGVATPAQIVSGVGTGGLIRQNNPGDPFWSRSAMYSYMNTVDMPVASPEEATGGGGVPSEADIKRMLAVCSGAEAAAAVVCAGLVQLMAKAMTLLPEEIDPERAPSAYGVDSLVAVGVRN
ncbi:beta-ketoacyl synthase domain-containing protein [Colletotrichum graminicola]|uniref:Beta-ketoacyl synthase domain-containing protein n=1 Tax=Colletotrichum graminicola (strain M1.001 / M2 / FGSC 10212) TaxID=645133 RepID=E3Q7C5_COLGM|nr:beta-ketoacyl synthase domain-containing protein [Colletotrichum graminicola M1.001]EFQ26763.1 beta-ketoacyl synthase domain-containing protein [Colletotrichum graminicola M1.001]WDK17685.1 beta-ketoacyl synthase domain-containing protein [Colletotrichum graminicola]